MILQQHNQHMHWWCIGTKNTVYVHWWIIFWFYMQSGWDIFLMINCCFVFNSIPSTNYCFIQTNSVQTRASQYFCTDISDVDYMQQCDAKMFLLLLKESSKKLLKYYQNIRSTPLKRWTLKTKLCSWRRELIINVSSRFIFWNMYLFLSHNTIELLTNPLLITNSNRKINMANKDLFIVSWTNKKCLIRFCLLNQVIMKPSVYYHICIIHVITIRKSQQIRLPLSFITHWRDGLSG